LLKALRYPLAAQFMPHGATNSAVISAASHSPLKDKDAHLFPVRWGEVEFDEESGTGHSAFTTARDVETPRLGRLYM
jgi:hypothetical protein